MVDLIIYNVASDGWERFENVTSPEVLADRPYGEEHIYVATRAVANIQAVALSGISLSDQSFDSTDGTQTVPTVAAFTVNFAATPVYSLQSPPAGCTIDPGTGVVSIVTSSAATGTVTVRCTVDAEFAEASFDLTINQIIVGYQVVAASTAAPGTVGPWETTSFNVLGGRLFVAFCARNDTISGEFTDLRATMGVPGRAVGTGTALNPIYAGNQNRDNLAVYNVTPVAAEQSVQIDIGAQAANNGVVVQVFHFPNATGDIAYLSSFKSSASSAFALNAVPSGGSPHLVWMLGEPRIDADPVVTPAPDYNATVMPTLANFNTSTRQTVSIKNAQSSEHALSYSFQSARRVHCVAVEVPQ